jgi:hypothetical protein
MTNQQPTREMLLEAWQAIGASEPLCHEMQNLCLMYIHSPASKKPIFVEAKSGRDTARAMESMLPPPQRRRRASGQTESHKDTIDLKASLKQTHSTFWPGYEPFKANPSCDFGSELGLMSAATKVLQ